MPTFAEIVKRLRLFYGRPRPPRVTHPLEMILYEMVAYLCDDEHRAATFSSLKKRVGTTPKEILPSPDEMLVEVCRMGGIQPEHRARRIRMVAELALRDFGGDLRSILKKPLKEAKKDLMKFPSVGEPGAEKILLFNKRQPVLALDSNGLRALQRLGFAPALKNYSTAYRAMRDALQHQLPKSCDKLIEAHQLLRRHGKELCKTSRPLCDACPLASGCPYFQSP